MIRRLTFYTLATCLFVATPALALPPVWTVRDADSEMVLFGSIHILPPALDWRPPPLDAALKVADDLWLEIPTDPGTAAAALVAPLARLPAHQTLDGLLSRAGRARLRRGEETHGLSSAALQTLRPWMVEVVLSGAQAAKQGANAEQILTADLGRTARLMAFETQDQQTELFAGASPRV
jgi:uncharacterized protein